MSTQLVVPAPQYRYLEPFKNRTYQYDTKHSNLFLAQYVNQILNAVGNDVIVRGLEITPIINSERTGINFTISSGSLIQDLTYFELPTNNVVKIDDVVHFPNYYIVIYTNWRYIQTVYDNELKIESTFYNPETRRAITPWNTVTNRIILGVFSYTIENGEITNVREEDVNIVFEDSNIIQNGNFDQESYKFWTAINSTLRVEENGGISDTPYLQVTPIADEFQGIAQVIPTKINATYEVFFSLQCPSLIPFRSLVLDGNNIYNMQAPEIARMDIIAPQVWTEYSYRFTALSTNATIFFLKVNNSLTDKFDIDNIFCLEYTESRKPTDINKIKIIDGGDINASK